MRGIVILYFAKLNRVVAFAFTASPASVAATSHVCSAVTPCSVKSPISLNAAPPEVGSGVGSPGVAARHELGQWVSARLERVLADEAVAFWLVRAERPHVDGQFGIPREGSVRAHYERAGNRFGGADGIVGKIQARQLLPDPVFRLRTALNLEANAARQSGRPDLGQSVRAAHRRRPQHRTEQIRFISTRYGTRLPIVYRTI